MRAGAAGRELLGRGGDAVGPRDLSTAGSARGGAGGRAGVDRLRDAPPGSRRAAPTGTARVRRANTNSRLSALNSGVQADSTRRV